MKKYILVAAGLLLSSSMVFAHGDEGHPMDGDMHSDQKMESMAGHGHMQGEQHMDGMAHNHGDMKPMKPMTGTLLKKVVIDGYEVSFHVMKAPEGMKHGGTHHLMVKVEQNNKIISLQAVNSKVTHPNGKSESKMMMKMGDWYMAAYTLGHSGEHKIMVLFKTSDGKKHFGGISYPGKT